MEKEYDGKKNIDIRRTPPSKKKDGFYSHSLEHIEDNVKVVEMDFGQCRGSTKSRNGYLTNVHVEMGDQRYSTHYYAELKQNAYCLCNMLLAKMSPNACSRHFDDNSSGDRFVVKVRISGSSAARIFFEHAVRIQAAPEVQSKARNCRNHCSKFWSSEFHFLTGGGLISDMMAKRATGGMTSLVTSDKCIFESPHVILGPIGPSSRLYATLPTLFEVVHLGMANQSLKPLSKLFRKSEELDIS
ncbi:hypothetical protein IFM89_018209 [Coptis chinensis]|uniref:Uncharacterized protein n=1 Tax=Coptis chinensis TaxID=261450 RepID=A0A835M3V2_9MAGN|nr:hypothetical protein IFM89_018209 [Coptis chinensis]